MTTTRRAHPTRRRLLRAALCLLLGAVTTVGVAWGVMHRNMDEFMFGDMNTGYREMLVEGSGQSISVVRQAQTGRLLAQIRFAQSSRLYVDDRGSDPAFGSEEDHRVERRTLEQLPLADLREAAALQEMAISWAFLPEPPAMDEQTTTWTFACGWPRPALRYSRKSRRTVRQVQGVIRDVPTTHGGLDVPWSRHPYPLVPYWPGALVDVFFHAAIWWLILAAAGFVKRWLVGGRRKRRGACISCGYDLRGLGEGAACPECGQAACGAARRWPALSDDC